MSTANGFPLRSFEVEGYRAIRHLRLPDLERVNLFVGLNNSGKTSLLEAVRLYVTAGSPSVLAEILRVQAGIPHSALLGGRRLERDEELAFDAACSLFHGSNFEPAAAITFGPADAPGERVRISLIAAADWSGDVASVESVIRLERGEHSKDLPLALLLLGGVPAGSAGMPAELVAAQGIERERVARLWSRAVESGRVPLVEEALRVFIPELDRVYMIGGEVAPRFVLKMHEDSRPVPISTLGRGVPRWFGIALALVAATGGVLLIDQVETALHHTVHGEVWESIFALAERLDVQVFATSHSWDAVVGFQYAANQSSTTGLLYRLDTRAGGGMIRGTRYTAEETAIAAEQQIEVR